MQIDYCYLDVECIISSEEREKLNFPTFSCIVKSLPHTRSCNALSCYHIHVQELMCLTPPRWNPNTDVCWISSATSGCAAYRQAPNLVGCTFGVTGEKEAVTKEKDQSPSRAGVHLYQHPVTQPGEEGSTQFTQLQLSMTLGYKNPPALWCYRKGTEKLQIKAVVFSSIW